MKALGEFTSLAGGYAIASVNITAHDARHVNLLLLIEEHGNIQKLADALGRSHAQISQLRNRSVHSSSGNPRNIGDELARDMEVKLGKPSGWMDSLHAAEPKATPYIDTPKAHPLSLSDQKLPPTTITWEQAMSIETVLPPVFELRMIDDAMSPPAGEGTLVKFASGSIAKPSQGVLVRTASGNLYFREYRLQTPERWTAAATNKAYPSFDSELDGLEVVAVFIGIETDWSQLVR